MTIEKGSVWTTRDHQRSFRVSEVRADGVVVGRLIYINMGDIVVRENVEISPECLQSTFLPVSQEQLEEARLEVEAALEEARRRLNDRTINSVALSLLVGAILGATAGGVEWYAQILLAFVALFVITMLFWYKRA